MSAPGALSPAIMSSRILTSPEAQSALDNLPNPISDAERASIVAIVNAMVASGNWDNTIAFCIHALADAINSLTYLKAPAGVTAMINVNGATHTANEGYLFNGTTQRLRSGIIPSTSGLLLNDTHIECYCFDNLDANDVRYLFGATDATNGIWSQQAISPTFRATVHTAQAGGQMVFNDGVGKFQDKTRYGIGRDEGTNFEFFVDGSQVATDAKAAVALIAKEIYIGCLNNNDTAAGFLNCKIGYFHAMISPDLTALNTELNLVQSEFNLN